MPDDLPPAPSESADDASKAETIRITLPPRPDQGTAKRETVRINLPAKGDTAPMPVAPKKETTKLTGSGISAPLPPAGARPFVPPPPGAARPSGTLNPPPKPPSLGARPTVPLKPVPSASGISAPEPLTQRAAPKKETARIMLPSDATKAAMPKATVKMQQTQPLVNRPTPALTQAPVAQVESRSDAPAAADGTVNILSIAAMIISVISLAIVYLVYSGAS